MHTGLRPISEARSERSNLYFLSGDINHINLLRSWEMVSVISMVDQNQPADQFYCTQQYKSGMFTNACTNRWLSYQEYTYYSEPLVLLVNYLFCQLHSILCKTYWKCVFESGQPIPATFKSSDSIATIYECKLQLQRYFFQYTVCAQKSIIQVGLKNISDLRCAHRQEIILFRQVKYKINCNETLGLSY